MLEYTVIAQRIDSHGSEARTKDAVLTLDTDVNGRGDAFNPAELLAFWKMPLPLTAMLRPLMD